MTPETLARLESAVGERGFSQDPEALAPHLEEWRSRYKGRSSALIRPASAAELSAVLAICDQAKVAVVPQGGNTGLVGAQIPFDGEVLISLDRMRRIREVDRPGLSLIAEAGVVLADVQRAAGDAELFFPLSLASEGSCTIGGNLSTNAGGVNVLRYGMARELVLGLEVVLADGRVLDTLRTLRKDNTGYDLKQLFIGAEGTLGIITAAALKLFPKPDRRATAFVAVPSPEAAVTLLSSLQRETSGLISAFELIPRLALELVLAHIPDTADPLVTTSPWYVLIEATSGARFDIAVAVEETLASAIGAGVASDAAIAHSEAQRTALWRIRESISEAQKREGASLKHDISIPIASVPSFLRRAVPAVQRIVPGARPVSFGHLGDGNIHFNFSVEQGGDAAAFLARWDTVQRAVHDMVREFGGSFSAEHGIGVMKRADMARYKSAVEVDLMRALKRMLDPNDILNPGKVLPD